MLTLALVHIRCDTLSLFVFLPAAGGGSADHAKWHVAEMQKYVLELFYLEICFCSVKEKNQTKEESELFQMRSYRSPVRF